MSARYLALALAATLLAAAPLAQAKTSTRSDGRVQVTLVNRADQFRDVKIQGHSYTVEPHRNIQVTAPTGTTVLADSNFRNFHRGDVIVEMSSNANHKEFQLK